MQKTAQRFFYTLALFSTVFYSLALGLLAQPVIANAATVGIPNAFTYQGLLKNSAGTVLTGSYDFIFNVYDAADGVSTLNAQQTIDSVAVTNGYFTVSIPLTSSSGLANNAWLDIQVAAHGGIPEELTPRVAINPVASSLFTRAIENAASAPLDAFRGRTYYDTALNKLFVYNGSSWVSQSDSLQDAYTNSSDGSITTAGTKGIAFYLAGSGDFLVKDAGGSSTFLSVANTTGVITATGLANLNGGIAVDTNNFTVSGTSGAVHSANTIDGTILTATTGASGLVIGTGANATTFSSTATIARAISFPDIAGTVTVLGNTFNGVNQLVQLTSGGILPVLNGSNLTNLPAGTLAGDTLASGVHASSLTSVGTLGALTVAGLVNINTSGSSATNIGTGGTGAVNIGNTTGNTSVTGTFGTSDLATLNSLTVTGLAQLNGQAQIRGGLAVLGSELSSPSLLIDTATGDVALSNANFSHTGTGSFSTSGDATLGDTSGNTLIINGGTTTYANDHVVALKDSSATSFKMGSTGAPSLLAFDTTGSGTLNVNGVLNVSSKLNANADFAVASGADIYLGLNSGVYTNGGDHDLVITAVDTNANSLADQINIGVGSNFPILTGTGLFTAAGNAHVTGALAVDGNTTLGAGTLFQLPVDTGSLVALTSAADGTIWYNATAGRFEVKQSGARKFLCIDGDTSPTCGTGGGGGGSTAWSDLTAPTSVSGTPLAINMTDHPTVFTYNDTTGTPDLFKLTDSISNTGTGYVLNVGTASLSSAKPFVVKARGSSIIDTDRFGNLTVGNGTAAVTLTGPVNTTGTLLTGSVGATGIVTINSTGAATTTIGNTLTTTTIDGNVNLATSGVRTTLLGNTTSGSATSIGGGTHWSINGSGNFSTNGTLGVTGVSTLAATNMSGVFASTNTGSFAPSSAPTSDILSISNAGHPSTANDTTDGLSLAYGTQNVSGDAIHVTPSFSTSVMNKTYTELGIDSFTSTNSSSGLTTVNGINIGNLTVVNSGVGAVTTPTALNIGSGWDNAINVNAGAFTVASNGNTTITGTLGLTGKITVATNMGLDTSGGGILNIGNTAAGFVNIGNSAGTSVSIGNDVGSHDVEIVGGAATTSTNTINIGTGTGAVNSITIGNLSGATGIIERVGTGNFVLDGNATSNYTIGASTTSGVVTLGGTAQSGTMTLGSSSATNTLAIADGPGATTLNLANRQAGGSVNIGSAMVGGIISIGGVFQTGTVTLGGGTGIQTINLGTGGTGAKTVTLGSTASTGLTTVNSGSGGISMNGNVVIAGSNTFTTGTGNVILNGDTALNGHTTIAAGKNLLAAAGSGRLDFSLSTGLFRTSTGQVSLNGQTVIAASKDLSLTNGNIVFGTTGNGIDTSLAGRLSMGATNATIIDLGSNSTATSEIDIGVGTQNRNVNIGTTTGTGTIAIGGGTGTIALNNTTTVGTLRMFTGGKIDTYSTNGTLNIGTGFAGIINVGDDGTGLQTATVNIATNGQNSPINLGSGLTGSTVHVDTVNWDVSAAGAFSGLTGLTLASGNILQTGVGSFTTGSGAVTLNGDTTIAANKNLSVTGTGVFSAGAGGFGVSAIGVTNVFLPANVGGNLVVATHGLCQTGTNGAAVYGTGNAIIAACTSTPTADYAEQYPTEPNSAFGDIMVPGSKEVVTKNGDHIVQLVKSSIAYQGPVSGIVSDNTGDFTSAGYNVPAEENPMSIALVGRVPVNVVSEGGDIHVGDFITTSSTVGKGMKATKAGRVIGMAISNWDGTSPSVMVQVLNTWYQPATDLQGSSAALTTLSGDISVANATFTGNVTVEGHIIGSHDVAGRARMDSGKNKVRVTFEKAYEALPIVTISARSNDASAQAAWLSDEDTTGFTINRTDTNAQVEFNWIAVGVQDAQVTISDSASDGKAVSVTVENAPAAPVVIPPPAAPAPAVVAPVDSTPAPVVPPVVDPTPAPATPVVVDPTPVVATPVEPPPVVVAPVDPTPATP